MLNTRALNFVEPQDVVKALANVREITVTTDYNLFNITDTPFATTTVISRLKDAANVTVKRVRGSLYTISKGS